MPEKPVLVLIGEAHPPSIEQILIMKGDLRVKVKEGKGLKRIVIDRSRDYTLSKESMHRVNEEIIKKQAEVLRKEKIARLLIERPSSQEAKRLYKGFTRTHDLRALKSGLRKEAEHLNAQTTQDIRDLFQELGLCRPLLDAFMEQEDGLSEGGIQPMLAFSHVSAAYKAGVFDIVPVDDEQGFRHAGALPDAVYLLGRAMGSLIQDLGSAFARYSQKELMQIEPDYLRIKGIVDKRIERVEAEREKAMCRNIIENYSPGSALLCGIDHLKPLEGMLSKRFDLKIYKTGEKLFASLSQGFQ